MVYITQSPQNLYWPFFDSPYNLLIFKQIFEQENNTGILYKHWHLYCFFIQKTKEVG
jgi:hypothetical protein